ncbi:MAG: cytochrome c oxidase subunit II [Kovacikia sp.]
MNIPSTIITMLAGILLTLVSIWVGQNHGLLPVQASQEAPLIDGLFNTMMTISTGLFLLVIGILIFSAVKFRQSPGDETDGPPVHGNIPLEILWTGIPAIIVLGLSIYSFEVYNAIGGLDPMNHSVAHGPATHQMAKMPGAAIAATLDTPAQMAAAGTDVQAQAAEQAAQDSATDPATEPAHQDLPQKNDALAAGITSPRIGSTPENQGKPTEFIVNAMGLQYAWIFTYPDTGIVSGELHLPVGREVLLNISASDVLHAFWVPEYRLKQDAVPGRQTELRFTPSLVGEYPVICAELCGPYHGAMKTKVIAQTDADFNAWVEEQKVASAQGLDAAIATNSHDRSPDEFLAPYIQDMGVDPDLLTQIHPHPEHSHSSAT